MPGGVLAALGSAGGQAALGLLGSAASAGAARSAANSQRQAAADQLALAREMWSTTRDDLSGFRGAGNNAIAALMYELGLGDAPMIGATPLDIETISGTDGGGNGPFEPPALGADPRDGGNAFSGLGGGNRATGDRYRVGDQIFDNMEDAQRYAQENATGGHLYEGIGLSNAGRFAMDQGVDSVQASAAARGGLRSGSTLQALENMRYGIAAQDRGNQLGQLFGIANMGMGAAGLNAGNNNAFAQLGGGAFANMGNASAAGAIGTGNAFNNFFNNLSGIAGYQKLA